MARLSPRARLYSFFPRASACPSILIRILGFSFNHCAFFSNIARASGRIKFLSKSKKISRSPIKTSLGFARVPASLDSFSSSLSSLSSILDSSGNIWSLENTYSTSAAWSPVFAGKDIRSSGASIPLSLTTAFFAQPSNMRSSIRPYSIVAYHLPLYSRTIHLFLLFIVYSAFFQDKLIIPTCPVEHFLFPKFLLLSSISLFVRQVWIRPHKLPALQPHPGPFFHVRLSSG